MFFHFLKKNVNLDIWGVGDNILEKILNKVCQNMFFLYFLICISCQRYATWVKCIYSSTLHSCALVFTFTWKNTDSSTVYEYYKQCGIVNVKVKLSCFQKHSIAHLNFPLVHNLWNNTKVYDDCDYANNTFHHSGHKAFHGAVIKSQMEVLCSHWCVQPWGQR